MMSFPIEFLRLVQGVHLWNMEVMGLENARHTAEERSKYLLFNGLTTGLRVTELSNASFIWKAPPSSCRTPVLNLFGKVTSFSFTGSRRTTSHASARHLTSLKASSLTCFQRHTLANVIMKFFHCWAVIPLPDILLSMARGSRPTS
ncbi:PREDICTED: uncharacterized protein LOC107355149 [Acropora digitifera]|uniref:uncharacterized protein LOC107355149 n=1 Tax=Acropora digitifera TaxID=70779 RepID=UPI00077A4627|nr:PREDICTED: uncharacterized protein LOC107355149 [Acropora digitifera]